MQFIDIDIDIIRKITYNINHFKDLIKFISSSKLIKNYFDEQFFKEYAYKLYSKTFWEKAYNRPIIRSKPLISMYYELVRIESFQKEQETHFTRWSLEDFYRFWKFYDSRIYNVDKTYNFVL
jgi:hypothetical protein